MNSDAGFMLSERPTTQFGQQGKEKLLCERTNEKHRKEPSKKQEGA